MRVLLLTIGIALVMPQVDSALAQNAAAPSSMAVETKPPLYEVVSIHENRSSSTSSMVQATETGLKATNVSLINLLRNAYDTSQMTQDLITGLPAWALKSRFDLEARVGDADVSQLEALSCAQKREMLRQVLVQRFKLAAHREMKEGAVYALAIGSKGPKLAPSRVYKADEEHEPGHVMMNKGSIDAVEGDMSTLAMMLTGEVSRPVYNKTGLTGKYDFKLLWTPAAMEDQAAAKAESTGVEAPPPLLTALQEQLGLRLETERGPVETLVIDHVEMPTAN